MYTLFYGITITISDDSVIKNIAIELIIVKSKAEKYHRIFASMDVLPRGDLYGIRSQTFVHCPLHFNTNPNFR